ncbi:hypothetical protein CDAR_266611 [Caerostris darwini]|uniref:Estradiol 17-beta-dehydrogenase 2 n=1 Tax=Caerostris darwini TaxID=1538125 RepID=A0AAV4QNE0_9ARAC|nr:hypothetical protein CDAR_266611 [Caerostris darwini]
MYRWLTVWFVYLICITLGLEISSYVLPFIARYYILAAKTVFCLCLTHWIFLFTRDKIFKKRVNPRNKAVFITGCDSGFGNLLAKQLDSRGFHVFAGCLFPTSGGAEELKKSCSERLCIVPLDVTQDDSVQKAKEFVEKNLEKCEMWAVVNNAGIYKGMIAEFTKISDFHDLLNVNALGQVRVAKAFLPLLRKSTGRIINVNSLGGRVSGPHATPYTMSKYASVAFTECLNRELDAWNIKVISIEPEFFKTPMNSYENYDRALELNRKDADAETKSAEWKLYEERLIPLTSFIGAISSSKMSQVTDAMEAAVSMEHPCSVYRPSANMARKIAWYILEITPAIFTDVFTRVIQGMAPFAGRLWNSKRK